MFSYCRLQNWWWKHVSVWVWMEQQSGMWTRNVRYALHLISVFVLLYPSGNLIQLYSWHVLMKSRIDQASVLALTPKNTLKLDLIDVLYFLSTIAQKTHWLYPFLSGCKVCSNESWLIELYKSIIPFKYDNHD